MSVTNHEQFYPGTLKGKYTTVEEKVMKILSTVKKRNLMLFALLSGVLVITSMSVLAQTAPRVARTTYQGETHVGPCCTNWDASITVTEPDKVAPIVVTWSMDYRATAPFYAALRLNGGPCVFSGPAYVPTFLPEDGTFNSKTFQWVILPGDYKLIKGRNVITVCGGGVDSFAENDTITLGFNTLSAELAK
jgi:hypothetical protein